MPNEYLNNNDFESIIQSFQYYKRQKCRTEMVIKDYEETNQRRVSKYGDKDKQSQLESANNEYGQILVQFKDYESKLTTAFYVLSHNLATYSHAKGLVREVDDATQEAVFICMEKVDRFNPNYRGKTGKKAKAFNYMTTCILNHFRQMYRGDKTYTELKKRYHTFLKDKLDSVFTKNGREHINQGSRSF